MFAKRISPSGYGTNRVVTFTCEVRREVIDARIINVWGKSGKLRVCYPGLAQYHNRSVCVQFSNQIETN